MRNLVLAMLVSSLLGYLVGTANPSYLFARRRGFDIRDEGSGNAGGSNALITMDKTVGIFCMLLDILKAYLTMKLTSSLFPEVRMVFPVTAVALVIGHIFPVWLSFRGGKGLACLGGILLAFSPTVFLCLLFAEAVILFVTKYLCFVPITASLIFPPSYFAVTGHGWGAVFLMTIPIVMVQKHRINLRRIKNGTEMRISYLWKKEEEWERVKKATEDKKYAE